MSVASQFSVPGTPPPSLDEFGHVALRRPKTAFSLSGSSVSSFDRLPADGQAHSECSHDEQPTNEPEPVALTRDSGMYDYTVGRKTLKVVVNYPLKE